MSRKIVDFCVFDADYRPLIVIEIESELRGTIASGRRRERRLNAMLKSAGVPYVRLWTIYGANKDYIEESLRGYIKLI